MNRYNGSHVICVSIGHTDEFSEVFNAVLEEAEKRGIYDPSIPIVDQYCTYNDG